MTVIDQFRAEHARIEAGLAAAEKVLSEPQKLLAQLKTMRADVVAHFTQKDAFYPALAEQCAAAKDAAGAQLTRIFESNMKVQSAAIQRFFEGVTNLPTDALPSSFATVAGVVRQRFGTEERAVFPLFTRTLKKEAP